MQLAEFECDLCDQKHELYVEDGSTEPDSRWPLGWLLMRMRVIGFSTDSKCIFCDNCRDKILNVLGFESFEEYIAVVKAQAEMEQEQARKAQELAHRNWKITQQVLYLEQHIPSEDNDLN